MSKKLLVTFEGLAYLDLAITRKTTSGTLTCPFTLQQEVTKAVISTALNGGFDDTLLLLLDRSWAAATAATYRRRRLVQKEQQLKQAKRKQVVSPRTKRVSAPPRSMTRAVVETLVHLGLVILTVYLLAPLPCVEARPTPATHANILFEATSCEKPTVLDHYSSHGDVNCKEEDEDDPVNDQEFTLVEKFVADTASGVRCSLSKTELALECGMFSHLSLGGLPSYFVPQPPSIQECRQWAETGEAILHGQRYPIKLNAPNIIQLATTGDLEYTSNSYTCTGVTEKVDEKTIKEAVVVVQLNVRVTKIDLKVREHRVYSPSDKVVLSCHLMTGGCVEGEATFSWDIDSLLPDEGTCQLRIVKNYIGRVLRHGQDPVFIDDSHKLYLTLRDQTRLCDMDAFTTSYEHLLLVATSDLTQHSLDRAKSSSVKLVAWISSRDDYLSYYAETLTQLRAGRDERARCLTRRTNQPLGPGLHHKTEQDYLFMSGEIVYELRCEKLLVPPRQEAECYQDLPVMTDSGPRFLEARTRLLKRHSAVVTCYPHLPPAYQGADGGWYSFNPSLTIATPPPEESTDLSTVFTIQHNDLSNQGGLISAEEMSQRLEEQHWAAYHATTLAALVTSSCHSDPDYSHDCPVATYSLRQLATPQQLRAYVQSQWSKFRKFAAAVGETSSFILLLILAIYLLILLIRTIWRCLYLVPRHGLNRQTALAALSLSTRIYNAWYNGEDIVPDKTGRLGPSATAQATEQRRAQALSENLDRHLATRQQAKRKPVDRGGSATSSTSISTGLSSGIVTDASDPDLSKPATNWGNLLQDK